jgi:hypothetical protein
VVRQCGSEAGRRGFGTDAVMMFVREVHCSIPGPQLPLLPYYEPTVATMIGCIPNFFTKLDNIHPRRIDFEII